MRSFGWLLDSVHLANKPAKLEVAIGRVSLDCATDIDCVLDMIAIRNRMLDTPIGLWLIGS